MATVEVRCPGNMRRLFMKLQLEGDKPLITEGNLLEFACSDCRKEHIRLGDPVRLVLHRYDFLGRPIETEVLRP